VPAGVVPVDRGVQVADARRKGIGLIGVGGLSRSQEVKFTVHGDLIRSGYIALNERRDTAHASAEAVFGFVAGFGGGEWDGVERREHVAA